MHESPHRFPILQPDTPVRFECTECGECCFDQTVRVDDNDVARMAGALGTTAAALYDDGTVRDGVIVMRRLTPTTTMCPFLEPVMVDDAAPRTFRCRLHAVDAKPYVCRLSPLARAADGTLHLVPPVDGCPGMDRGPERPASELLPPM